MKDRATSIAWIITALLFVVLLIAMYRALRPDIIEEIFEDNLAPFEGFANSQSDDSAAFHFCPADTKYYINKNGESLCCNGEVAGNRCLGDIECTFSAPKDGIRSCGDLRTEMNQVAQARLCPTTMPNYYEDNAGNKGCTASGLNVAGTSPINAGMPKCKIYGTADENLQAEASCQNLKALEEMECISPDCKKSVQVLAASLPAILTQTFTVPQDEVPVPRMCMDKTSYERYLTAKVPNWRSSNDPKYDMSKNLSICDLAKRFYILKEVIPGLESCAA